MGSLILQLAQAFVPMVLQSITDYRAANNGTVPTEDQLKAHIAANADKYLAEYAAWQATHPKVD